jgi:arabinan endo-1,5-alpha-L-arabinosidase
MLLRPRLEGEFRLLGPNPQLPPGLRPTPAAGRDPQECVDHHVFQSTDGAWHLWGCIRRTAVGRVLYHWQGRALDETPWPPTGEIMRASPQAGESLDDWQGEEWIQSPFVVRAAGRYYFFYGGHGTGQDAAGRPVPPDDPRMDCQICLMTSADGRHWQRHVNADGFSQVFAGPGEARDPCLLAIDGVWHLYYAGYAAGDPEQAGIFLRRSHDLLHWSEPRLVHSGHAIASGRWSHECPQVVARGGSYYLFRTADYASADTHVFRSDDPADFGIGPAALDKYVGPLAVAAPEIILDPAGREYITSNHDLQAGTQICRLVWEME